MNQILNKPFAGIAYFLWMRMRWIAGGLFAYVLVLAGAVQILPMAMNVALFGTLAVASVVVHLLTVLTFGPADLGARSSGFPESMMVLPLRTRSLVGWPMLFAVTLIGSLWIIFAVLIMRPSGLLVPVFWPAALGGAATAWLQAIGWSPFPSPFARVPALLLAMTPLMLLGACAWLYLENDLIAGTIVIGSVVWILVAYAFAVQGLARARAGSGGEMLWNGLARTLRSIWQGLLPRTKSGKPFRSAFAAQLWHDLRRNAAPMPIMFAFVCTLMLFAMLFPLLKGENDQSLMIGGTNVRVQLLAVLSLIAVFMLMGSLYGPGMGKFDVWGKDSIPAFYAIRPMSTWRLVLIKMLVASLSALMMWCLLIAAIASWAIVEAIAFNSRESLVRTIFASASWKDIGMAGAASVLLLLVSIRGLVVGMWTSLTGRKWAPIAYGIVSLVLGTIASGIASWIYKHPAWWPVLADGAPWGLAAIAVAKLSTAACLIQAAKSRQIIDGRTAILLPTIWLAVCLVSMIIAAGLSKLSLTIVVSVILSLPLVRIAAAPLALHWNRHR